jgi:[ribosomal protein S5]-alanine N-acetyltransferase
MSGFADVRLESPRLVLRQLDDADADDLLAIFGDPEVMRYWSREPWADRAEALEMVARDRLAHADGSALRLGIEDKAERRIVGTVALFNLSPANRRGEIGYALARACWGRGMMHEALSLFVDWALANLSLHRLEADIDPANKASARSLLRLGFQREGLLRERWLVEGQVADTEFYGLLAREWRLPPG